MLQLCLLTDVRSFGCFCGGSSGSASYDVYRMSGQMKSNHEAARFYTDTFIAIPCIIIYLLITIFSQVYS